MLEAKGFNTESPVRPTESEKVYANDAVESLPREPDESSKQISGIEKHEKDHQVASETAGTEGHTSTSSNKPSRVFAVEVPQSNVLTAIDTIKTARNLVPQKEVSLNPFYQGRLPRVRYENGLLRNPPLLAAKMADELRHKVEQPFMKERFRNRSKLPLMANKSIRLDLLKTVAENDVTIVLAKTGSGKTTQVPQLILEDEVWRYRGPSTSIICAQPRRIAATSTARRVAYERNDVLGRHVGYKIRNEDVSPVQRPSITYYTIGILMHRLLTGGSKMLEAHSHIIIDEVHERDAQIDMVLSLLRKALSTLKATRQPYPKIILMSATIDPGRFLDYFREATREGSQLSAESFEVEGRHHTVQTHFLPDILKELSADGQLHPTMETLLQGKSRKSSADYIKNELYFAASAGERMSRQSGQGELVSGENRQELEVENPLMPSLDSVSNHYLGLVVAVVAHISFAKPEGDVLVFLPGKSDIDVVYDALVDTKPLDLDFQDESKFKLFKLHSSLRDTNDLVFEKVPPGCRRIILATNIAETSITLPDVVYVVDTGKARTSVFDPVTLRRSLPFEWISRTSSIQRRGRAGRVRDGHYYALFSQERYETFGAMARPRITVSNIVDIVLLLLAYRQTHSGKPKDFLRGMMDPPSEAAIESAYKELSSLGAITDGKVTRLGWVLAQMGISPSAGKALLLGALFGCLEPMLILACHDFNNPLIYNGELSISTLRETKRRYDRDLESDLPILIDAFREYHAAYRTGNRASMAELRESRAIQHSAYMEMILTSRAIHEVLAKHGFVPPAPGSGDTIFETLPSNVNFNKDDMVLVKALAVNTISAEMAAWSAKDRRWELDAASDGYTSRSSVNYDLKRSLRKIRRKHRSDGRLMAYSWKRDIDDSEKDEVWLEHTTMVTPLVAVLFSRSVNLTSPTVVELNDWLRLEFNAHGMPPELARQTARILTETKKTLERFVTYCWRKLLRNIPAPEDGFEEISTYLLPQDVFVQRKLAESGWRNQVVNAITTMLRADDMYWAAYRARRRAEIDAEEARLKEEARQMSDPEDEASTDSARSEHLVAEGPDDDDDNDPSESMGAAEEADVVQDASEDSEGKVHHAPHPGAPVEGLDHMPNASQNGAEEQKHSTASS